MSNNFFESLDTLIEAPKGEVRTAPQYTPKDFSEPCASCRGTGNFRSYSGRVVGPCFKCKGAGKKTFKTSPEARAKVATAKVEKKAASIEAFKTANPEAFAWLVANPGFEFAASLMNTLLQYGDLTDGQLNAINNILTKAAAKKAERAAEQAARTADAPSVDTAGIDRLKASFDTAAAYIEAKGLKRKTPMITIGGLTISPAKSNSANPGALYVKDDGGTYLGKVANGRFFSSRECTKEDETKIVAFVANPAEAAKVYGQTTGTCCVCNASLRSEWKHKGIGPICAEKFGW